ncbi:MAG: zf-HC2 domain-containing protein [Acidobacteriota bacterium]
MIRVPCGDVREQLEAYHDGELSVDDQLHVREHLVECVGCACESGDLVQLRRALRDVPGLTRARAANPPDGWTGGVLEQVRVERALSWQTWLRGVFDDMHLVWPAIGATFAVVVCLLGSAEVMQATNEQRPDSLAGIIDYLASPGSNGNPARLDSFIMVPRRHAPSEWPVASEDAVLALSAVVTREGRIQNIEMLAAEQARALKVKPEVVLAMIDAASRAQFEPARAGGAPIAVSMVWLLAHTTVVGSAADVEELMRPLVPKPAPELGPRAPRPVAKPAALRTAPPVVPIVVS